MVNKIIKPHSDNYFVKRFNRYILIENILNSHDWSNLEDNLKKNYNDSYQDIMKLLFNEFKFYNCVLDIEYAITDSLNNFLIKEKKVKNWGKLENRFLEKTKISRRIDDEEAKKIIEEKTIKKISRILSPDMMLYVAGFGIGELINYISEFTNSFPEKRKLVNKLTEFNESRKILIHNRLTSREDVEEKMKKGISLHTEIIDLINKITNNSY